MNLITIKLISIILIIFTGIIGGLIALRFKKTKKSDLFFSLGNCFAAGIFLGAGLIHMIPDAIEGFSSVVTNDYPWAPLFCAIGFLLILFIEKVIMKKDEVVVDSARTGLIYPYILIIVLSVHSIIVGIALGTEETVAQSLIIIIAILAHKGSAAFALAVSMFKGNVLKKRIVKLICVFSLMTPLGILLGTILVSALSGKAEQFSTGIFDAIAAGTFLYVAIMDIMYDEYKEINNLYLKIFMTCLGLLLMALLAVWL